VLLLLFACTPAPTPDPPPSATIVEGVHAEVDGMASDGWLVSAGTVLLTAGTAKAADVTLAGGAAPLEISAQRSEWDLRGRTARFTGDVTVTRAEVAITCGLLEVTYKDADHLDRVAATGGVEVSRGGRHATAERAEIRGETGEITLTGSPTLAEGPNRLVGDRITLFLDDERAVCEGAQGAPCRLVVDGSALK
jgi:lipopolysaccharide export system protein LptA